MTYIKVILPLKLNWEPFYRTSDEDVAEGMRVSVRFAGRKYVGVVSECGAMPDVEDRRILDVDCVERRMDPISPSELKLWRFISEYYLCTVGEVYKLAYPAGKTAGEQVSARAEERRSLLAERERELWSKRMERLEARLKVKDDALARKHSDRILAELSASREKIVREMELVRGKLDSLSPADEVCGAADVCPAERMSAPLNTGKPQLVQGGPARLDLIVEAISDCISAGRDALMLVPDIALSKSLQTRLRERFGDSLMAFNSTESAGRRREIAAALRRNDSPKLILGTRSAIFLPFNSLGLVVVEEEHDSFYKQDGTPRFNARDLAVVLGNIHGARVILSSPTPSLESLLNCHSGRYNLIELPASASGIEIVDTSVEARKRGMVGQLSRILISATGETLRSGGRVLILRPWGPLDDLRDEVRAIFPEGDIEFAGTYEARRMDIGGVALLAIIGSDVLLDKTDFRADERLSQTLEQIRSRFDGTMLVQTRQGAHPAYLRESGYALKLLAERKAFNFPPYTRMVDVVVRDNNPARLRKLAGELGEELKGFEPSGPFAPMKGRTPEEGVLLLRITLAKDHLLAARKAALAAAVAGFETSRKYQGHIVMDVDPA